jgi:hypothetical protein
MKQCILVATLIAIAVGIHPVPGFHPRETRFQPHRST